MRLTHFRSRPTRPLNTPCSVSPVEVASKHMVTFEIAHEVCLVQDNTRYQRCVSPRFHCTAMYFLRRRPDERCRVSDHVRCQQNCARFAHSSESIFARHIGPIPTKLRRGLIHFSHRTHTPPRCLPDGLRHLTARLWAPARLELLERPAARHKRHRPANPGTLFGVYKAAPPTDTKLFRLRQRMCA